MKKILLPISERDYDSTNKRFFYLIKSLSENFIVEVLTISKEVLDDINNRLEPSMNVTAGLIETQNLPFTLDFRTNLVKVFIQYTYGLFIPQTDLKLWKTAAFDDFWGHISTCSLKELPTIDSDLVMLPLMTYDDTPIEEMDVFYTSILFRAKEAGIKVAGYQLYPVFQGLKLMVAVTDAIVVRKEYEKKFYIDDMGIPSEKIHLLTDQKDIYSLSTIDDAYKNNMYNSQIPIGRGELAIVVCNHVKYRPLIRKIIKAIGEAKIPVVLFLSKREYQVKDLNEDQIIESFYFEDIKNIGCRFFVVDSPSTVTVAMISDVIISPTYVAPVEFAARHEKKAFVYNPFYEAIPDVEGTVFFNKSEDLTEALKKAYKEKKQTVGISDIASFIMR